MNEAAETERVSCETFASYNRSAVRYVLSSAAAAAVAPCTIQEQEGIGDCVQSRLGRARRRAAIADHAITALPISNYRWRCCSRGSSIWIARVLGNWNWRWLHLRCWPWLIATKPDFGCCHLSVALANFRPGRPSRPFRPIHYWHCRRDLSASLCWPSGRFKLRPGCCIFN